MKARIFCSCTFGFCTFPIQSYINSQLHSLVDPCAAILRAFSLKFLPTPVCEQTPSSILQIVSNAVVLLIYERIPELCQRKTFFNRPMDVLYKVAYKSFSNQHALHREKRRPACLHKLAVNTFQKPVFNLSNEHFKRHINIFNKKKYGVLSSSLLETEQLRLCQHSHYGPDFSRSYKSFKRFRIRLSEHMQLGKADVQET